LSLQHIPFSNLILSCCIENSYTKYENLDETLVLETVDASYNIKPRLSSMRGGELALLQVD
jgi:hypothetical protein